MLITDFSDIQKLTGKTVFSRGLSYAEEGRVGEILYRDNGRTIRSLVRGSGSARYTVRIITDPKNGEFIDGFCNCPYTNGYCEHIAAVLIVLVDSQGPGKSTAGKRKRSLPDRIDLSRSTNSEDPFVLKDLKMLGLQGTLPSAGDSPRDLILCLEAGPEDTPGRDRILIRPAGRYRKEDGSPGRIDMSGYVHTSGTIPKAVEKLIYLYESAGEEPLPFSEWISLLSDPSAPPLVYLRGVSPGTLRQEPLERAAVRFTLESVSPSGEPLFLPEVALNAGEFAPPADWIGFLTPFAGYWLNESEGVLYFTPDPTLHHRELQVLISSGYSRFTARDARDVSGHLDGGFFSAAFPYQEIIVRRPEPRALLEIRWSETAVQGLLLFEYGNVTVSYNRQRGILTVPGETQLCLFERDEEREEEYLSMLREHSLRSPDPWGFSFDYEGFFSETAMELLDRGFVLYTKSPGGSMKPLRKPESWRIDSVSGIDWLDLRLSVEGRPVAWSFDEGCETLEFDDVVFLDPPALRRFSGLLLNGEVRGKSLRVSARNLAVLEAVEDYLEDTDDPGIGRMLDARDRLLSLPEREPSLPSILDAVLRPYQKQGYLWLDFLSECGFGGILADDMGLGKTLQAISLMAKYIEQDPSSLFLVLAPVSTLGNWAAEIGKFLPSAEYMIHRGTGRADDIADLPKKGTIITSYGTLRQDVDLLRRIEWRLIVFDESQALKNAGTSTYRCVRALSSRQFLALSGTPVENSLSELWGIMDILNPGLLGSRKEFKKTYTDPIAEGDETASADLRMRVRPFILRRKKEDVAKDLPGKEEVRRFITMSRRQEAFYRKQRDAGRARVQRALNGAEPWKALPELLAVLTTLRQTAVDPSLTGGPDESAKLDALQGMMEDIAAEGHKALIFSQFVRVLAKIRRTADEQGWRYAYLDGRTRNRERQVALFQDDPCCTFFLISLKAGGVGLNLTAADYVILLDPWWNPAVERQAVDRAHRIGRKNKVIAYSMITEGTIEERVLELQEKKRALAENIFSEDSSVLGNLTPDEILSLFR